jgi:hypothetical protein
MSVTINEGTQTAIKTTSSGGEIQHVRPDGGTLGAIDGLTNGTVRISVGTISTGTLQNLATGTINALASGTISAGTIQISQISPYAGSSYATLAAAGGAAWGTLVGASGAGTRQYVNGVALYGVSGTVRIAVTTIGIDGWFSRKWCCNSGRDASWNFYWQELYSSYSERH